MDVDTTGNFISYENPVNILFNDQNLPEHITFSILDNYTGNEFSSQELLELELVTDERGSFPSSYEGLVELYPVIGEQRYNILFHYGMLDKKEDELFPEKFFLSQNYPNPFNPITNIKYEIPKKSKVEINVYDISGQRVKTLVNEIKVPGYWSTYWDGSNNFGQRVSSGMYLYTIVTNDYKKSRKLIFMK